MDVLIAAATGGAIIAGPAHRATKKQQEFLKQSQQSSQWLNLLKLKS